MLEEFEKYFRTSNPVLYALRCDMLLPALTVGVSLAAVSFILVLLFRSDSSLNLIALLCLPFLPFYYRWRRAVMQRRLSYEHVFSAHRFYEFRYFACSVPLILVLPLSDCILFFGPYYFGFVLAAAFALSLELHLSSIYGKRAFDALIAELGKVVVFVFSVVMVLWLISFLIPAEIDRVSYIGRAVALALFLVCSWLVFRYFEWLKRSSPADARYAQCGLFIVLGLVLASVGYLVGCLVENDDALIFSWSALYCVGVVVVEVVNALSHPVVLGPVE
ncbi:MULTISPECIES: hypothetical protein [unclassified Bradyrhizobium]|uniref:hypothetical protein n=1 Tax=unclassified Bradyrhizobium TaxID=2631580 RepID=UPI0028E4E1CE|nr:MULTISPECIES: hypothetical protein [unclassified Bradyrhizobium]